MKMKDKKPMFCTVVDPSEYDIARDVKRLITIANKNKEMYAPVDVGKFVGLYEAWEEQAKEIEFQKTEAIKINVDWGKAEATIAEQAKEIERLKTQCDQFEAFYKKKCKFANTTVDRLEKALALLDKYEPQDKMIQQYYKENWK